MNKFAHSFLAAVLLSGCAESARDSKPGNESPPVSAAKETLKTPPSQTATADPTAAAEVASATDAASLLASTLEEAKAQNKRVMVHLGAPW
jgi:hypothetical protein